jgi:soluble lytic murein transglycosylase-like protein
VRVFPRFHAGLPLAVCDASARRRTVSTAAVVATVVFVLIAIVVGVQMAGGGVVASKEGRVASGPSPMRGTQPATTNVARVGAADVSTKAALDLALAAARRPAANVVPALGSRVAAVAPDGATRTTVRTPAGTTAASTIFAQLMEPGRFAYQQTVRRIARRHSVEVRLVMAIIASESRGDPAAVSPAGAIGLMQLMPGTAADLGVDPWDPEQNLEGAVRYLATLLSTFKSVDLSLVAYNAGPVFAERYRLGEAELGAETRAFLIRVGHLLQ